MRFSILLFNLWCSLPLFFLKEGMNLADDFPRSPHAHWLRKCLKDLLEWDSQQIIQHPTSYEGMQRNHIQLQLLVLSYSYIHSLTYRSREANRLLQMKNKTLNFKYCSKEQVSFWHFQISSYPQWISKSTIKFRKLYHHTLRCCVISGDILDSNLIFSKYAGGISRMSSSDETCLSMEIEVPILIYWFSYFSYNI